MNRRDQPDPVRRRRAPDLPDTADPDLLDRSARAGLRSLPESLAAKVASHLVAAGQLIDDDPKTALAHAAFARQLAPRLAVVREAVAIAAYRNSDYAGALADFRALRRMTGDPAYLPVMADCERGLGRPDRAIALGREVEASALDPAGKVELAIVVSGARRDRGEFEAAVAVLGPLVKTKLVRPWTARLWYAYAEALLAAGRRDEAASWFASAAEVDADDETDADERAGAVVSEAEQD